jgi:rieske iron-sulfur protein
MLSRRALLKVALGAGVTFNLPAALQADEPEAKNLRPQTGDVLVFAGGTDAGKVIRVSSLELGGAPVFAWPMDPTTSVIRDGKRLNRLLVLRLRPAFLSPDTRAHAAGGSVVAYSAICTHEGCPVSEWLSEQRVLECPCHGSQYDPANEANVIKGPAQYRLANLPLKMVNDMLVVAGKFVGKLGAQGG